MSRGTLYNTLLYLSPDGEVMHRHRKLMPTFTERTIWGFGDGSDLDVLETPLGRLGGLICWEHQMTLAKYALYAQGEQVHCAVWPAYSSPERPHRLRHAPVRLRGRLLRRLVVRHRAAGLAPEEICAIERSRPTAAPPSSARTASTSPDRSTTREEILYAEIDLEQAIREKHSRDVAGHYARPDVLQLVVNATPQAHRNVSGFGWPRSRDAMEAATAEEVVDRLETVREYLGSLIDRIETDGDSDVNEALAEAMAVDRAGCSRRVEPRVAVGREETAPAPAPSKNARAR